MTTNYHYDRDSIDVLYETNGNDKVIRQYVYSDSGVRLAMKMNGKTLYYHYNAHGDVVALTDEAGKVVAEYAYDAWGNVLKSTATTEEAKANPYGYAGYTYDKEIEQYYLMARYYDPEQGVFTAIDPDPGDEDDPQTMNGYNYANNNPVKYVDPDGNYAYVAAGMAFGPIGWGVALGVTAVWAGYQVYKWHKSKKGSNYSYSKKKNKGKKKLKTKNVSKKSGAKNYLVNVTRRQLERRLRTSGWKSKSIGKGVKEFSRNGRRIVTRKKSRYGRPTADYWGKGRTRAKKFRLK
ncbi:RHS repeat-associated core domain-containing protein [Listeria ivanovii]|nr:RHS repeat-associated core domain-containing protein [Listeria ivanovii]MBC2254429.1 RHS repeat-associated core domain-containing protein [Listeria ivanovii]